MPILDADLIETEEGHLAAHEELRLRYLARGTADTFADTYATYAESPRTMPELRESMTRAEFKAAHKTVHHQLHGEHNDLGAPLLPNPVGAAGHVSHHETLHEANNVRFRRSGTAVLALSHQLLSDGAKRKDVAVAGSPITQTISITSVGVQRKDANGTATISQAHAITSTGTKVTTRSGTGTISQSHTLTSTGARTSLVSESWTAANGSTPAKLILGRTGAGGSVSVQNNMASFSTGTTGGYSAAARVNRCITVDGITALSIDNVDVTVDFTYVSGESFPEIVLRSNNSAWDSGGTGYILQVHSDVVRIVRVVNYTFTTLASTPFTYVTGTQYQARFRALGSSLLAGVGAGTAPAIPQHNITDSTITAAGFVLLNVNGGSAAASSTVRWDNLLVLAA